MQFSPLRWAFGPMGVVAMVRSIVHGTLYCPWYSLLHMVHALLPMATISFLFLSCMLPSSVKATPNLAVRAVFLCVCVCVCMYVCIYECKATPNLAAGAMHVYVCVCVCVCVCV